MHSPRGTEAADSEVLAVAALVEGGWLRDAEARASEWPVFRLDAAETLWLRGDVAARVGDRETADACWRRLLDLPRTPDTDVRLYGLWPLERLAASALESQNIAIATIYALRAVRADRGSPEELSLVDASAETLRIRTTIAGGDFEGGEFELATLFEGQSASACVRRLAGELAWARGDAPSAQLHWRFGADASIERTVGAPWVGAREADARAWCLAATAVLAPVEGLPPLEVTVRDTETASAALVLALALGEPVHLEGRPEAVQRDAAAWVRLWVEVGATGLLDAFEAASAAWCDTLPDLGALVRMGRPDA